MDFDSNNKTLRPIYDKLDSLINNGYDLSYVFKDIIFRGCSQFDRDYSRVSCWVQNAGNTAESGWTKDMFELYQRVHLKKWVLFKLNNILGQLYSAFGVN